MKEFREEAQAPVVPASAGTTATATETTLRSDADSVRTVADETVDETGETARVEEVRTGVSSRDDLVAPPRPREPGSRGVASRADARASLRMGECRSWCLKF